MRTINELCAYIKIRDLDNSELEEVNTYLENRTDPNDKHAFFLFRSAIFRAHVPTLELLIKHIKFHQTDEKGITLLMCAAAMGRIKVMHLLLDKLEKPADKKEYVNLASDRGNTALHIAAKSLNNAATISFLLENGADPNIIDDVGDTFKELVPAIRLSISSSAKRLDRHKEEIPTEVKKLKRSR